MGRGPGAMHRTCAGAGTGGGPGTVLHRPFGALAAGSAAGRPKKGARHEAPAAVAGAPSPREVRPAVAWRHRRPRAALRFTSGRCRSLRGGSATGAVRPCSPGQGTGRQCGGLPTLICVSSVLVAGASARPNRMHHSTRASPCADRTCSCDPTGSLKKNTRAPKGPISPIWWARGRVGDVQPRGAAGTESPLAQVNCSLIRTPGNPLNDTWSRAVLTSLGSGTEPMCRGPTPPCRASGQKPVQGCSAGVLVVELGQGAALLCAAQERRPVPGRGALVGGGEGATGRHTDAAVAVASSSAVNDSITRGST